MHSSMLNIRRHDSSSRTQYTARLPCVIGDMLQSQQCHRIIGDSVAGGNFANQGILSCLPGMDLLGSLANPLAFVLYRASWFPFADACGKGCNVYIYIIYIYLYLHYNSAVFRLIYIGILWPTWNWYDVLISRSSASLDWKFGPCAPTWCLPIKEGKQSRTSQSIETQLASRQGACAPAKWSLECSLHWIGRSRRLHIWQWSCGITRRCKK